MKNLIYVFAALFFASCTEELVKTDIEFPSIFENPRVNLSLISHDGGVNYYDTEEIYLAVRAEANKGLVYLAMVEGEDTIKVTDFMNPSITEKAFSLGKKSAGLYTYKAVAVDSTGLEQTLNIPVTISEVKEPGLVFHVNFDGGSPNDLIAGLPATTTGTPSFGTDKAGIANNTYQGAASSYYLYDISTAEWKDQDLTISFYYKNANQASSGRAGIVTLWDGTDGLNGIATLRRDYGYSSNWGTEAGDTWAGSTSKNSAGGSTIVNDIPYSNEWQLVTYTVGNNVLKVYVDGVLSVTNNLTSPISWAGVNELSIGSGLPNYDRFSYATTLGQIDDVRIYDSALTQDQIKELMK